MAETQDIMNLFGNIAEAIATRPQKSSVYTDSVSENRPYALDDLIKRRDSVGASAKELDEILKMRETPGYTIANALANVPQQQGAGSWLTDFARSFGGGMSAPLNAYIDRAMQKRKSDLEDLDTILKYDKEMGGTTRQRQSQSIGYENMPYSGGKGGAGTTEQIKPKVYDFSDAQLPEQPVSWGELDIQGYNRVDPETGIRTPLGGVLNYINEKVNPQGHDAMTANQTAYAEEFTTDRIAEVAKATGGNRGIDTMPEVTLKGGPELAATNMSSRKFAEAVRNRAWDAADQIIKANPNATITREELANAFINNFNHKVRFEYRVVRPFGVREDNNAKMSKVQETPKQEPAKQEYDYSKYGTKADGTF